MMKNIVPDKEEFLHYIWTNSLFLPSGLKTICNKKLVVIKPGVHNFNSGPDFMDARIDLDGVQWAGNVEIHLKTSDWYKHNHHLDPAYSNVILHVVFKHDRELSPFSDIPVLELAHRIPNVYFSNFLMLKPTKLPCINSFSKVKGILREQWLSILLRERLEYKATKYMDKNTDIHEGVYRILAAAHGFSINNEYMLQVAQILPYKTIRKYTRNLTILEALFLGISGFLDDNSINDNYIIELKNIYNSFSNALSIKNQRVLFKWMRTRPGNFPVIRLIQFAAFLNAHPDLIEDIKSATDNSFFDIKISEYWSNHIKPGIIRKNKVYRIGKQSKDILLADGLVPSLFLIGRETSQDELCQNAIELWYKMPFVDNKIVRYWKEVFLFPRNMADSQALMHAWRFYCAPKRCLHCLIGNEIILNGNKL